MPSPDDPKHRDSIAKARKDAEFELVAIKEYYLPLLHEPVPPLLGQYEYKHTKAWSEKIASFDAFVFVTPEYNHSASGALKNAIDYLYHEWNNKAAEFVSSGGGVGCARAVEHLRLIMGDVMAATVRAQVLLSLNTDFEQYTKSNPDPRHEAELHARLDQVIAWGQVLKMVRLQLGNGAEVRS